jgi:AraC-like DNA-binding protein
VAQSIGKPSRRGYDSEVAFNRAFRRLVGSPPATWRQVKAASNGANAVPIQR